SGALLSLSGDKKISVYSLGAQKLRFTIERVMNDDISHLVSQTRGDFGNPSFKNYSFTAQNITERFGEEVNLPSDDARKPQFSVFDFAPYLTKNPQNKGLIFKDDPKGKGLFFLTVEATRKDKKGDVVVASDHRFVLVSDLGLVVKTSPNGSHDVFVQSIKTGDSVSGAKVAVLGLNGLPVVTVNTDGDGRAVIPSLQSFANDKRPVVYVVRNGQDLAFMPYESRGRSLNYSRFDTDGLSSTEEGLRAYLFSDRGIYRPGEDGHIGIVVKQDDWAKNLAGVPLQLEVTNPRGQVVDKPVIKMNAVGFAEYGFSTHDHSPTGVYTVRLYIIADGNKGTQLGSTSVRVEEFLPDTLKIASAFNKPLPKGWLLPEGLKATVSLQHLYGAPAVDHRVKADISIQPGGFSFKEFADYQFFDALKAGKSYEQPVGEAQTDSDGQASFNLQLSQFGNSTYRMTFDAEGFAQDSGRSVHTAGTVLVSSLPYVVGMKSEGNLGYINKKEERGVQFIAVNPDRVPIDAKNLKLQIARVISVPSLIKNEQGAYQYRSILKESITATKSYGIPAKGAGYTLDSTTPGSYVLILSDENGRVLHRIAYTIVGEGNLLGHSRKEAQLTLTLDKHQYAVADTIKMNIISPFTGTGLITLETDKVLAFKWFKTTSTSSVQTMAIPNGFTGKGFVNVQFVRSLESKEIYTTPLAYHVEPFFVSTESIDSQIKLTVPEKAKPGETLVIQYKTKGPGKIVIYAVDEGILQYSRYKTPDPLDYYVNRRALQVETSQILDLLMPEYSIMQALSATGGDGGADFGKNLNPFKRKTQAPAVFWSGIIDADETQRQVRYAIPDYFNGSLRVMAVAVSAQAMGKAENKTFVQGDIIISPNVPTFAAPGDEFTVGLSLANNISGSGKSAGMKLVVTPSEHLEVLEGGENELTVAEGREVKVQVRVKAKDILGGASLTFTATAAGGKPVKEVETLSVRPPMPSMTVLLSGYAEQGEKQVAQPRNLYKEFATVEASVSTLPISLVPGLAQFLERFPYGCTEQIVSKAFPAVILSGHKDLVRVMAQHSSVRGE
ncbi:MAG: alpha-2-macroglobulin family protein, partial [Deltaproteobacteria bacterium]|nr:alpha-2-macroglobulin family protein [Deltaproteobacteria bacterium]